ncbi:MAG: 50S ribosomal protein L6 [Candidatus Omnitrophica bacterium]|nr:50S ribosomal protein L6 [Candidatus Omnitrophota bacterium]
MSRIGKKPVVIPQNVKAQMIGQTIHLEGPKGKHQVEIHPAIRVNISKDSLVVERKSDIPEERALHGLVRSLLQNAVTGITDGFVRELEIEGVGFRAQAKPSTVSFSLGFSHPIEFPVPAGIKVETPKPTQVVIKGVDKYLVGQVAANIRRLFEPEPYKGKGVRYKGEQIRRKQGKAVG